MGEFIFGDISKYEPEVKTVKFDWKPSKEYSIDEMDRSYSLDLEVLSDSHFGDDS
ncbi:hypothetical protein OZX57_01780 [Bifidobacterium sp. ESL0682]|uniref:hypothetical protein n=1 Tax=Bifidobacterium sp. ESL0682 TaxID=2983212 RepID=UPI0023F8696A|nr:hypothetical protein [Bifidobacterium sp. ESL0682]WEV42246.1 hypothetical protein OZX57_01780 [Bifidobacterium sp. ESL0682]